MGAKSSVYNNKLMHQFEDFYRRYWFEILYKQVKLEYVEFKTYYYSLTEKWYMWKLLLISLSLWRIRHKGKNWIVANYEETFNVNPVK